MRGQGMVPNVSINQGNRSLESVVTRRTAAKQAYAANLHCRREGYMEGSSVRSRRYDRATPLVSNLKSVSAKAR
jgi:hypothetical protein